MSQTTPKKPQQLRKTAIHKQQIEKIDYSDIIEPSPSKTSLSTPKPSPSKPKSSSIKSPIPKQSLDIKPKKKLIPVLDYSSDSANEPDDDLPDKLSSVSSNYSYKLFGESSFLDIYQVLERGFQTHKWKDQILIILLRFNLLKNKKLSGENIISIFELLKRNDIDIISPIATIKGDVVNISDYIYNDVDKKDEDKKYQLQFYVMNCFLDRFRIIMSSDSIIPYDSMIKRIFCDKEIDHFESIIDELIFKIEEFLNVYIISMIQAIDIRKIGSEEFHIKNIYDNCWHLYNYLQDIKGAVKNTDKFDVIFQTIVDFQFIYYLYKLEFFKKEEDVVINDFTSKYYYNSIRKYRDVKINDSSYTDYSVMSSVTKDKILLLCETIIENDKDVKNDLESKKEDINECFNGIFKSLGNEDKYKFISKYFLKIYEDHDFPGQMCGIYDYSVEYMENMLLPTDYKKIKDKDLLEDNIFKKERLILTSFIDLLGINLSGIDLHDKNLSKINKSIISTELIRTLAIFVDTNEYLKYEPISDDFLKEFDLTLVEKKKPSKKKPKPTKVEKEKKKEIEIIEEKKKEIEDIDEKIRKMEEEGNRDITKEIRENKENFLKFNEDIIKKIRTDFFHGKFDKEGNIILNLPTTIQSSKGLWNLGKLRQFLLFNFLKEYLIYVMSHYSSSDYLKKIRKETNNNAGQMVLQGGACVQYYSKAKRITYDLDYKFYPDRQKNSLEEQLNFLKKYLLPFFKDIDLDEIIEKRNIICSSDDSGLSSSMLSRIKENLKDFELLFFYDERGIIKVYIQYTEIFSDKKGEREESRKHSLLDISLSKPDDKRNINLIRSLSKNKKTAQLPDIHNIKLGNNLNIVLLDKDYLKQERNVLIKDSDKDTPEFITEVPTFDLKQTKKFMKSKMQEQLDSLDGAKKKKKSLKRYIHKSIKKSIQRRRTTLRKSKRLSMK